MGIWILILSYLLFRWSEKYSDPKSWWIQFFGVILIAVGTVVTIYIELPYWFANPQTRTGLES